ncbi:hypothetical protein HK101_001801, partial [Irineochytrium annulatum]
DARVTGDGGLCVTNVSEEEVIGDDDKDVAPAVNADESASEDLSGSDERWVAWPNIIRRE